MTQVKSGGLLFSDRCGHNVAPMSTTVIEFDANEVGDWFLHCFFKVFAGVDLNGVRRDLEENRVVFGIRYLLPLNLESRDAPRPGSGGFYGPCRRFSRTGTSAPAAGSGNGAPCPRLPFPGRFRKVAHAFREKGQRHRAFVGNGRFTGAGGLLCAYETVLVEGREAARRGGHLRSAEDRFVPRRL